MPNRLAHETSPVPAPARGQPRRLVAVVRRGLRGGPQDRQARVAERRVQQLPLVPRHGARVVRGPGHRRLPQRALRQRQGRPRGAAGRGRRLHGSRPGRHGPGRLAHDRVPHPGRRAVLLRHLLPARPRHGLPSFRQVLEGVQQAWTTRHDEVAEVAGKIVRDLSQREIVRHAAEAPGEQGTRAGPPRAHPRVRPAARRVRRRAEVPAVHGAGVPAAAPRADRRRGRAPDGPGHVRADGPRRDLRPARRRIRPVLRRPGLDRAALREDAVRQRPALPGLRPPVAGHRIGSGPARRAGDRRLPRAGTAHGRGRVRLRARRRQRRRQRAARGRGVLRVDARTASRGAR